MEIRVTQSQALVTGWEDRRKTELQGPKRRTSQEIAMASLLISNSQSRFSILLWGSRDSRCWLKSKKIWIISWWLMLMIVFNVLTLSVGRLGVTNVYNHTGYCAKWPWSFLCIHTDEKKSGVFAVKSESARTSSYWHCRTNTDNLQPLTIHTRQPGHKWQCFKFLSELKIRSHGSFRKEGV